jgi:hypothetical protein
MKKFILEGKIMKIKYISLALAILSLLTAQTSQAAPIIDGIVGAGEYANTSSQSISWMAMPVITEVLIFIGRWWAAI